MKKILIKNLCDGARDYPLKSGDSIYLGARGRAIIDENELSEALKLAERKRLVLIEEINSNESGGIE